MVLQLADGFSANTPGKPGVIERTTSNLQKLDAAFKKVEALKAIPVVGNAIAIISGLISGGATQERALYDAVYNQARNVEVYNWWRNEGKTGDPYTPLTVDKVEWLVSRLTSAANSMANKAQTSSGGQKRVDQRWAKVYADLATEIANDARRVTDSGTMAYGKYIAIAIGGLILTYLITRRK